MKHALRFPNVSSRRLQVVVAIASLLVVLALLWYAGRTAQEGQRADTSTDQRDAARGAAEQVIDCVNDPSTTPEECEDEAQKAQETLEEQVPPATLSGRQRREVVLIASQLIAATPEISEDDVVDEVLEQLPDPETGDRGRPGPAGEDAEPPSTAEIRELVEAVYADDPPPPGDDGRDGTTGPAGGDGKDGKDATPEMVDAAVERYCSVRGECIGPRGADGPTGPAGTDGAAGRGIASMSCDAETQMFVVTYTDGTSEAIVGSDCIADGPLSVLR